MHIINTTGTLRNKLVNSLMHFLLPRYELWLAYPITLKDIRLLEHRPRPLEEKATVGGFDVTRRIDRLKYPHFTR